MSQDRNPSSTENAVEDNIQAGGVAGVDIIVPDDDTAPYEFNDRHIQDIRDCLEEEDFARAGKLLEELGEADIAELLTKVESDERSLLLSYFAADFPPETYLFLESELQNDVLEEIGAANAAAIVGELNTDDALDLLEDLDPVYQKDIIRKLSAKDRAAMEEGLNYPEASAGRLMQREFVAIPQFWTAGKTIDYLRAENEEFPDHFSDLFLIDPKFHVMGQIPLHSLVRAKRSERVDTLITEELIKIPALMDQEEVARLFRRSNISTAPVVDDDSRMLGVITLDDVADIIEEEAAEDILRLGGVSGEMSLTRDIRETAKSRFPWLFVNLFTAMIASFVVGHFSNEIMSIAALAALMPMVAGMGGNAGTQTLTVTVRALATKELSRTNAWRMIKKEVAVGMMNGALIGLLVATMVIIRFNDPLLAAVMGSAMIVNLFAAGFCGICIPMLISKLKLDPALSSGVWLTAVTDIVGFFTFLGLASLVLL